VLALVWTDIAGLIAIVAVCGGMFYLANRIEPHWVSRDGSRFLTTAQEIDQFGVPGRKREVRVLVDQDSEALVVTRRSFMRPSSSVWTIASKSPKPPKGRVVFHLKAVSGAEDVSALALRLPERSRILPRLEQLLEETGDEAVMRRERLARRAQQEATEASADPGSPPPDQPADRG
jgi:hypothetical protein